MSPTTHLNTSILLRMFGGRIPVRITNSILGIPGIKLIINSILRLLGTKNTGRIVSTLFGILIKISKNKTSDKKRKKEKKKKEKRGTIGIPHPDTDIKILDIDSGEEISWEDMLNGKTGELLLNGPQRMLGYWPDSGAGIDDEGYIHTGDVVKINKNGYFYIVDRIKDMIIISGYKVYSKEIDDILYNHPKVKIAATIGIPDSEKEGSEKIIVFIEPKNKYKKQITEQEIIDYLKTRVAKYSVPKIIIFIDSIPLTELEKVDKKLLRKMAKKN